MTYKKRTIRNREPRIMSRWRKGMLLALLLMCSLLMMEAQTIQRGNRFYDGAALYTVSTIGQDGVVTLKGNDPWGGSYVLKLKKKPTAGRYELMLSREYSPFRCKWGSEVQYYRQQGMNFLGVKNSKGQIVEVLTLTPDNLQNCTGQHEQMVAYMSQEGLNETVSNFLLDTHMTIGCSMEDLQSVAKRLGGLSRPSIIEKTNRDLLLSEIAYRNGEAEGGYDNPDGLGADGRGSDEVDELPTFGQTVIFDGEEYIRVTTAEQFLNALGTGRSVLVAKNTEINLSPLLDDQSAFRTQYRLWRPEYATEVGDRQDVLISEEVFDGRQLTLVNMKQMTIRGEGNSRIVVEPRYAFCLNFKNCDQIEIHNLTIGHVEGGNCQGGVIGVQGGWRVSIHHCDLYGCGTYGLQLQDTRDFSMYSSNIHDCTYGIMTLRNVEFAKFEKCDFFRNREFSLIESRGSNVNFYQCRFFANHGDSPLFNFDREFFLAECEVYHPTENLGTINLADQSGPKNKFVENPFDRDIKSRGIGPDQK